MALIGWARVSTESQDLETQLTKLEEAGVEIDNNEHLYQGKHSGKSGENDKKLDEMIKYVRKGDTVICTKLDRLGRSLKSILDTLSRLKAKGVTFKTLDGAIDTTNESPFAEAQLSLIGVFAQLERDLIVTRTTEGRKTAQAKGVKFGRKSSLSEDQQKEVLNKLSKGQSIRSLATEYEVSRTTVMRLRDKNKPD